MSTWQNSADALADLLEESPESVYDEAPCGYVSSLPDGTILKLNRTLGEWLRYPAAALLGRRLQALLTIGSRIYYETHYAPLLAMQGYVSEIAVELRDRGGNSLPVLLSARQQRDALGAVRVIRTVVFNASERRRYEQELLRERQRAQRNAEAKAELLRMLSHDVRTPLGTIMNIAQLLASTVDADARQRQLRILQNAAQGLLSLVNNVLDTERLEAAELRLQPDTFALCAQVEALLDQLRVTAEEKGLTLTLELDPQVPARVTGDAIRLLQVLTNLIGNAVKFTERGGIVVRIGLVERTKAGAVLAFSVQDSGIGIPADRIGEIFQAFNQVSEDIGRRFGGSGLGLTICKRIIELHGSRLEVESTPGTGSRFQFVLRLPVPD